MMIRIDVEISMAQTQDSKKVVRYANAIAKTLGNASDKKPKLPSNVGLRVACSLDSF
jgi:hypothetical protein